MRVAPAPTAQVGNAISNVREVSNVDSCARRVAVRVEQWQARHTPGDFVLTGETLGYFARRPIKAPYAAVVENVAFERESRSWLVTLVERVRCQ